MIVNPETLQTGAGLFELDGDRLRSTGGTDEAVYPDKRSVLKFCAHFAR